MIEYTCGSPVCKTRYTAATAEELMGKVSNHVVVDHRIPAPTKSLVQFVVANCVHETAPGGRAG
jgi:Protein of unknown function (DUF1059)